MFLGRKEIQCSLQLPVKLEVARKVFASWPAGKHPASDEHLSGPFSPGYFPAPLVAQAVEPQ